MREWLHLIVWCPCSPVEENSVQVLQSLPAEAQSPTNSFRQAKNTVNSFCCPEFSTSWCWVGFTLHPLPIMIFFSCPLLTDQFVFWWCNGNLLSHRDLDSLARMPYHEPGSPSWQIHLLDSQMHITWHEVLSSSVLPPLCPNDQIRPLCSNTSPHQNWPFHTHREESQPFPVMPSASTCPITLCCWDPSMPCSWTHRKLEWKKELGGTHLQLFLVMKNGATIKGERRKGKIGVLKSTLRLSHKTRKAAAKCS